MPKNLYQRAGQWYGRFSVNGKLRRVGLHTSDLKSARERLKALKKQAEDGAYGIEDAPSWAQAVIAYRAGVLDGDSLKPTTATRYGVSLRQIDPYFRTLTLPDITVEQIGRFVAARQKEGATNATIRRDLTTISRVLAYASASGLTPRNIAVDYDRTLVRERRLMINAPDDATIGRAAALAPVEWGELVRWLRATGMRLGEALRAHAKHIHGDEITIQLTKSGRPRTIEFPEGFTKPKSGFILSGLPHDVNAASSGWAHLRRKHKDMPRFRLHDLRHAYAISEIRNGRDIYDLSRHLGHSSVKVTEIYLGYKAGDRSATKRKVAQNMTQDDAK